MLVLYGHPLALNSTKVHLVLVEAARAFEYRQVDLPAREHLRGESLARNPFGRLPYLDDDGVLIAESNTIMRYLASKWGLEDLYPAQPAARARVEQWMDFVTQHLTLPLGELYVSRWFASRFGWTMDLYGIERALRDLKRNLPLAEAQLARGRCLTGPHPTLADLALLPFVAVSSAAGLELRADHPHLAAWRDDLMGRASWKAVRDPRWPAPED